MAHHVHSPYQFIRAKRSRMLAILLIREPALAIASLAVRGIHGDLASAFRDYSQSFTSLRGLDRSYIVATFDDVLGRLGRVITCVNTRYQSELAMPWARPYVIDAVMEAVDRMDMADKRKDAVPVRSASRPSQERRALAEQYLQQIKDEDPAELIRQAEEIFIEFGNVAADQRRSLLDA